MDLRAIKEIVLRYRSLLIKNKIQPDIIILFGSHAKGQSHQDSDIDLAIVSRNFGKNPTRERIKLNRIAHELPEPLEVLPVAYDDYMKSETISPILDEIFKTGIVLF